MVTPYQFPKEKNEKLDADKPKSKILIVVN